MDSIFYMIFMALLLGVRHGFDLDHLATIDAITRTVKERRFLSRLVGFLFSLGHGVVIIAACIILGAGIIQTHMPEWLEGFGNWVSIVFLFLFGLLNLWNIFQNQDLPVGIKSFLAKKITPEKCNPLMIMGIGGLFAISFDTMSQIALFSLSATLLSSTLFALIMGLFFMFGMMISDGLNGLLVSYLIQRADKMSQLISRSLGVIIALFSLAMGAFGLLKMVHF